MEDKKLTGEESLELISRMIQSSKERLEVGRGNHFLYWGYFTAALSVVLFALVQLTRNPAWSAGWLLMFAFWIFMTYINRREKPIVTTYTDRVVSGVWKVIGPMFALTFLVILGLNIAYGKGDYVLMLPLSLLYAGIGVSVTGIIIREPAMTCMPLLSLVIAVYMLMSFVIGEAATSFWFLYFGFSFMVMMIVPGHILNRKARRLS